VSGACFDWSYDARLQPDQEIDALHGTSYVVIYDFFGAVGEKTKDLTGSLSLSGDIENVSVQPFKQHVPDSPSIPNVRVNISSLLDFSRASPTDVFSLDVFSTVGGPEGFAYQSAQALKHAPGSATDDTLAGNTVLVTAPKAPSSVPEPATTALLGTGLLILQLRHRRKRIS
jgi:hypothetical protein